MTALEISRAWARMASNVTDTAGGFFTVANNSSAPDRLVAARSPAAERIEIHAIKVVGTVIRMRPLENGLVFHPGFTVHLRPRGYHLLMTGLKALLVQGAKVPVTLTFEKAGEVPIELAVEAPGPVGDEMLREENRCG
jgi:periplasmic copper chaperone A